MGLLPLSTHHYCVWYAQSAAALPAFVCSLANKRGYSQVIHASRTNLVDPLSLRHACRVPALLVRLHHSKPKAKHTRPDDQTRPPARPHPPTARAASDDHGAQMLSDPQGSRLSLQLHVNCSNSLCNPDSSPHPHRMTFPGALVPGQALTPPNQWACKRRRPIGINAPTGLGMMGDQWIQQRLQPASLPTEDPVTLHMGH